MLRDYQIKAVEKIESAIKNGQKKIKVEMAVGTGRFFVLSELIKLDIFGGKNLLIITATKRECEQLEIRIGKVINGKYDICTYKSVEKKLVEDNQFDVIIFNGIFYGEIQLDAICKKYSDAILIGFTSVIGSESEGLFEGVESTYSYSYSQAVQEGYINRFNYDDKIVQLCIGILQKNGYNEIKPIYHSSLGDVEAVLNGQKVVFEIRYYREKNVEKELIYRCVKNINSRRHTERGMQEIPFYLFMFCSVDEEVKEYIKKEFDITIWDISNIIYLCSNSSLYEVLGEAMRYSLVGMPGLRIEEAIDREVIDEIKDEDSNDKFERFEVALKECPKGNENNVDRQYEKLCVEIIRELFEPALERFLEQKATKNHLFKMDLMCAIKSEEGLWKFLKHFYKTNYIVFEFKNYSKKVSQNNIFITEKYLSTPALRNVAIIVSRYGFDESAKKIAISELHSRGYLIIDITDEDLMQMLAMKQTGANPEDHIQEKIDKLLMEIDV